MAFEPWRANFICELYENTKEAVEVAEKHYLQSLIATSMKREMKDFSEKYGNFVSIHEGNLKALLDEVLVLEQDLNLAMTELKRKSDEYYLMSSHGYPFKVETMTYSDCKLAQLPDFSKFSYERETTSFGPLSEKWESLKARLEEEFVGIFCRKSTLLSSSLSLTSLRGDWKRSSNLSISDAGESEMNRSNSSVSSEKDDEHNSQDSTGDSEMPDSKVDDAITADKDSAQAPFKPTVMVRQKLNISMNRPMSQISTSLLLKSAKMAEGRRLLNSHAEEPKIP